MFDQHLVPAIGLKPQCSPQLELVYRNLILGIDSLEPYLLSFFVGPQSFA